jgi:FkbM family methyltransferase
MLIDTPPKKLNLIVDWLNDEYPYLQLVMYDIGARYGIHYLYTQLLNLRNFSVIGFEPDKQETVKLDESSQSGLKNIFPFALAVGQGMREIYITKHPGCSSLYRPNQDILRHYSVADYFEVVDTQLVETISLDLFTQKFDVEKPDFLKIDIQGAEFEVLKGGLSTLNNVVGIFLETQLRQLYTDAPLFPEIHTLLIEQGFRLISCEYNPHLDGEIVEFDVAYVKDSSYLEDEKSVLKAVLFCLIHKNVDYAANIVRKSNISEVNKLKILEFLSQPLILENQAVNPECLHINSKMELRKINEDWWQNPAN